MDFPLHGECMACGTEALANEDLLRPDCFLLNIGAIHVFRKPFKLV